MMDIFSQRRLLQTLRWIIRGRWVLITLAGLGVFVIPALSLTRSVVLSSFILKVIILFAIAYNTFYWWYVNHKKTHSPFWLQVVTVLQVVFDQLLFTVAIYYTGGIESQAFMFYAISIIVSSVLFTTFPIVLFALFTCLLYLNLILFEFYKIIPHVWRYEFDPGFYLNSSVTAVNTLATLLMFLMTVLFSILVSQIIRDREQAILSEQEKVTTLFQSFPDGLVMLDPANKVLLVNPVAEKLLAVRAQDIMGRDLQTENSDRFTKFRDIVFHAVKYDEKKKSFPSFEYEIREPKKMFLQIATVVARSSRGEIIGTIKVLHDITREKAIEVLKSEFISVAAHQLRTPLSAIKWVIKLVMDGDAGTVSEEQKSMLQKGFESNERMIRLVNDLLNVSRIEEGRFQYNFSLGDIVPFLKDVVQELQPSVQERKIQFSLDIAPGTLPQIRFDGSKLRLAVQNLIDNAIRYTPEGGRVTVRAGYKEDQHKVYIEVADTGVGIPPDQQEKIFTKFFRADNVVRMQTDGSGLGLFIVKNIVEKHGGQVGFTTELGKGTTFHIFFPVHQETQNKTSDFENFMGSI